jgi:hypothetical protein
MLLAPGVTLIDAMLPGTYASVHSTAAGALPVGDVNVKFKETLPVEPMDSPASERVPCAISEAAGKKRSATGENRRTNQFSFGTRISIRERTLFLCKRVPYVSRPVRIDEAHAISPFRSWSQELNFVEKCNSITCGNSGTPVIVDMSPYLVR